MKVSYSTAIKLTITNNIALDNIAVYVENVTDGAGKLTITCFNQAWSYYWGSMGEGHNLYTFIPKCDNDYLVCKFLGDHPANELDMKNTVKFAKEELIRRRKEKDIDPEMARDVWDTITQWVKGGKEITTNLSDEEAYVWEKAFGQEFWNGFRTRRTSEYNYLNNIVTVVKEALKQNNY